MKGRDSCTPTGASPLVYSSDGVDESPVSQTEFFDYFEEFGIDDYHVAVEPEAVGDDAQLEPPPPHIAVDEPREVAVQQRDLIGRHWVTVDPSNIVAGPRTRGVRRNYED